MLLPCESAIICSNMADDQSVSKGAITACVKGGVTDFAKIKAQTKVGAGCGGCVPLATSIFKAEMRKLGHSINNK
jgi:nitrite reductase (NAD(P)H)